VIDSLLALVAHLADGYIAWDPQSGQYAVIVDLMDGRAGWHISDETRRRLQLHGVPLIDRDESPPDRDATDRAIHRSVVSQKMSVIAYRMRG
jgi:hypothetical protein